MSMKKSLDSVKGRCVHRFWKASVKLAQPRLPTISILSPPRFALCPRGHIYELMKSSEGQPSCHNYALESIYDRLTTFWSIRGIMMVITVRGLKSCQTLHGRVQAPNYINHEGQLYSITHFPLECHIPFTSQTCILDPVNL